MPNRSALICGIVLLAATCRPALSQTSPTIRDITAILDQEKPNVALLAKGKALADAEPSRNLDPAALYAFYLDRGRARAELGNFREAAEDGVRAAKAGQGSVEVLDVLHARSFVVLQLMNAGEYKTAREQLLAMERDITNIGQSVRGRLINNYRWTITSLIRLGDLAQADGYFRRLTSLRAEARTWNNDNLYGGSRDSEVARARADLAFAKGQYSEAEVAYRSSIALVRETIIRMRSWPRSQSTKEDFEQRIDIETSFQARAKANQGRLAEAEADVRGALLSRLRANGKYAVTTANQIGALSSVISLQGRYAEAEQLERAGLEIKRTVGVAPDSDSIIATLRRLSSLCSLQERHADAALFDAEITVLIKSWDAKRRQRFDLDGSQVYSLFATGRIGDGVTAAQTFVTREIARLGEAHPDVALARGTLATGYAKAGRDAEALAEFRKSVPALLAAKRATDVDESAVLSLRNSLIRNIVESYAGVLVRSKKDGGEDTEGQAFQLIDAVRGRAVHQAVMASTARMAVRDKSLADLVRKEQDQEKQIDARLNLVNNLLARAPDERDDRMVGALNKEIEGLRAANKTTQADIARRFPTYAELIDPKSPSVADMRAVLRPGEVLISFYFGREQSFVWALPKEGALAFTSIAATGAEVDAKIAELRKALEPDAEKISQLPAFDLALASDLYELLLKPVEAGWRDSKSLIIVTNGALGLLPLGLLPTSRVELKASGELPFAEYRGVPWLARTRAITLVPSATALKVLRQLPPGSSSRDMLIGFGDPYFNEAQAAEAAREGAAAAEVVAGDSDIALRRRARPKTRGVDGADFGHLPRLADTAEELKAVAQALRVDGTRGLNLGKAANEYKVKTTDLSRYRIVAFATHGLLPGDLLGLTEPALAFTAPAVAGVEGDGLLTMEEILALKLDADWVLLSACNTSAGTSSGADALSGLGRAFFYAGARSLLITNWSVDSASARALVTDLFRRQAADPSLARGEALRRAMMALVDEGGRVQAGKMIYSYAHPLFWAPYSIVGEGGAK
jgi:CHAT domain-containing protein